MKLELQDSDKLRREVLPARKLVYVAPKLVKVGDLDEITGNRPGTKGMDFYSSASS